MSGCMEQGLSLRCAAGQQQQAVGQAARSGSCGVGEGRAGLDRVRGRGCSVRSTSKATTVLWRMGHAGATYRRGGVAVMHVVAGEVPIQARGRTRAWFARCSTV